MHINTWNDKLIHKCPYISYTQNTHSKLTDAQDENLHTHIHQSQHIGIHVDFRTCTCIHTFIYWCIQNKSQNLTKSDIYFPLGANFNPPSFFFFFWPHHAACGILVPQTGMETEPLVGEAWRLNHWTVREAPSTHL